MRKTYGIAEKDGYYGTSWSSGKIMPEAWARGWVPIIA